MIELLNVTALITAYRWARQCIGLPRVPPGWRSVGRYCYTPEIHTRRSRMESFRQYLERRKAREERVAAANKEVLDRVAETMAGFDLPLRRRARDLTQTMVVSFVMVGALLGLFAATFLDGLVALLKGREVTYTAGPVMERLLTFDGLGVALTGAILLAVVVWAVPAAVRATMRRIGLEDVETDDLVLQSEETSSQEPF